MERIPEPDELMEDPEQAEAYARADFAEPHEMFVRQFRACFPDAQGALRVLDLGSGAADVLLRFARNYPACRIDGIEGSRAMLTLGRQAVTGAGLQGRITLIEGRLPDVTLSRERYDVVISNSLLHHLDDPSVLWETARKSLLPRGRLFVMDLTRPDTEERARELVSTYADGEAPLLRRDFHHSLLAAYTPAEVRTQLARAGLGALRVEAVGDRHLVVWGRAD